MSFLAPLYALGLLAISAPLVLHLIRRTPRVKLPFSALMFLKPSPPRMTRRSRLDNWPLLLLRALVLILLALAFTRPFQREGALADLDADDRRRVAILIDQSCSMRRGAAWNDAVATVERIINDLGLNDQIGLFAFDETVEAVLDFNESSALDRTRIREVGLQRLREREPSWRATRLDRALIDTLNAVGAVEDTEETTGRMPRRIILVSDLQQGSHLEELGGFEWPSDVDLQIERIVTDGSNAGLHPLGEGGSDPDRNSDALETVRVRVSNAADSVLERFRITLQSEKGSIDSDPIPAYVPPGESRVVRVPRPSTTPEGHPVFLQLEGDSFDFDNRLYLTTTQRLEVTVPEIGNGGIDDPNGSRYYLHRVFGITPGLSVSVQSLFPEDPIAIKSPRTTPLVVLTSETNPANAELLHQYLLDGGTVLFVPELPGPAKTLARLAGVAEIRCDAPPTLDYALLQEIDFTHPIFEGLVGPQFSDFTKIRFWSYRKLDPAGLGDDCKVIARFDTGDPALLEFRIGRGRLVVMTSGWSPEDSQLARSSKFVPMLIGLLTSAAGQSIDTTQLYRVGDSVNLPSLSATGGILRPDGTEVLLDADVTAFGGTDEPGVYGLQTPTAPVTFAVNLDPRESRTTPMEADTLEQFGCLLVSESREEAKRERSRQLRSVELERRQRFWRWLIVAALAVLISETWLAGWCSRPRELPLEAEA